MMKTWLQLIVLSLFLGSALAQSFTEGTEFLLTDLSSDVIVGHGKIIGTTLDIKLSQEARGFFLYLISPDGNVATHQGQIDSGLINVFDDAGALLDFSKILKDNGITLNLERLSGSALNPDQPSDDGRLGNPGGN